MAENVVLRPPEVIDIKEPIIFIAGPIQGAPDWQSEAIEIIHERDSGIVVASPRKNYAEGTFVYEKQVDWETEYLARAAGKGAILFWLAAQTVESPGRAYAQTTRFELGEHAAKHVIDARKMVIGIEEGFGNERYIRRRLSQDSPDIDIYDSLEETCDRAVELARESDSVFTENKK